jgi:hypothetical protein
MLQTFITGNRLASDLEVQKAFYSTYLQSLSHQSGVDTASFSRSDLRRMRNYTLQVPVAIGESLACLLERPLESEERENLTFIALLSVLHDDLQDNPNGTSGDAKAKLLDFMQAKGVELRQSNSLFNSRTDATQAAQTAGLLQQHGVNIPKERLKQLSYDKCGLAFLLASSLVDFGSNREPETWLYQFGGVSQLGDDILDDYDDAKSGIKTMANTLPLDEFRAIFHEETAKCFTLLKSTSFPEKAKKLTAKRMAFFLAVFDLALAKLTRKTHDLRDPEAILKHPREYWILDMAKTGNKVQTLIRANRLFRLHY